MKILMIIKRLDYSGAPKMFMWVANNLAKRGMDVTILTYMKSKDIEMSNSIKWVRVDNLENKGLLKKIKEIRKIIKEENFDCSISFLLDANVINILSCLLLSTKSIVCERNDPFKPKYYKLKILKPLFCWADGAVFQLEKVREYYNNIKGEIAIIPNPVRHKYSDEISPFLEREDVVVTVGRLDIFQKRQDLLIKAFHLFSQTYPTYKLHIYGDGSFKDTIILKQLISELGMQNKIFLMGAIENPQKVISKAKMFILTSDFEGIPNSLIEAMSIGLPCIATDCSPGGAALLIKDNINGYLVPTGDYLTIVNKMIYLVEEPQIADKIGHEAKNIVVDFSEEFIINKWTDYLQRL